jgi:hypothetical protein
MSMQMYVGLHVTYPLFLSDISETWIFSSDFRKKSLFRSEVLRKFVQGEPSCYMRTDRETQDEAIGRFLQFYKRT